MLFSHLSYLNLQRIEIITYKQTYLSRIRVNYDHLTNSDRRISMIRHYKIRAYKLDFESEDELNNINPIFSILWSTNPESNSQ